MQFSSSNSSGSQRKIKIGHLKDSPEHLDLIATWIYNEWWVDREGTSVDKMKDRLREATTDHQIPLSLIAFVDSKPAGTINLIESDNSEFPELKPWLAALLVHPDFRKQGVGAALINELLTHAKKLNVQELYLGTDIPKYYEPFGAKVVATGSKDLKIMKIELS